ncbi:hypothetical protein RYX36_009124 [Vicia faba]
MSILEHAFMVMCEIENILKIDSAQDRGASLTVDGGAAITGGQRRSRNRRRRKFCSE